MSMLRFLRMFDLGRAACEKAYMYVPLVGWGLISGQYGWTLVVSAIG